MRDAIVVGGGHNGLVCAFYLARAGLKVTVLEQRAVVGGAAVTEEFHPGFRNSVASYTVSLLNPKVIREMDLPAHGLRVVERPLSNFLPLDDTRYLKLGAGKTKAEVAKFSQRDAERLDDYARHLDVAADLLRELVLQTPPNRVQGGWLEALPELLKAGRLGNRVRKLPLDSQRALLDLFTKSAGDVLDGWFESAPIKAAYGFDSVVGNYASPYTPGSAYVLLHHVFGEVNGKKGAWGHAVGGMGAITQAMAKAAQARGVEIRTGCAVDEILLDKGRATGVVTARGERLDARVVVSNLNPRLLYTQLVDAGALPPDFLRRMQAEHHGSGIIIAPSLQYMERAYHDARALGWAREPIVEVLIPSTLDPGLAPPGQHVASLFCQHVASQLPDGASWDQYREQVADLMIATVTRYAPNFERAVIGRQIMSPLDLERTFGLIGGDIFHGALGLDQLFAARPMLGHADYRGPLKGLYTCGAGAHPGGGVTGAPGHNAAREVLRDLGHRSLH